MAESYYELLLEKESGKAESTLMSALKQADIFNSCYAYKSRVKSEVKLVEKVLRKKKDKPAYELKDITDLVGVRLVTLFRLEMSVIFEKIIDLINHRSDLSPNPFKSSSIEEIIVYSANPLDEIPLTIENIAKAKGIAVPFECRISKEGYSSIHVVSRLNQKVSKMSKINDYFIPVEIQIRTVFEDAWGEIDHKYGYVIRTGKEAGSPVSNPEIVLRHLKIMKKFADACGEYADSIHLDASQKSAVCIDSSKIISVGYDDEITEFFSEIGISVDDISLYRAAREKRAIAETDESKFTTGGFRLFLEAAEAFRVIGCKYDDKKIDSTDRPNYIFYFYIKMNEALCLMSANDKDHVTAALNIYKNLEAKYNNSPLAKMRLAQAYNKCNYYESSIEKYEETYNCLKSFESEGLIYNDVFHRIDYEHMKKRLPIVYGYALWRKAESLDISDTTNSSHVIKLLKSAYDITVESCDCDKESKEEKYNNLLYYALEIVKLSTILNLDCPIANVDHVIRDYLTIINESCDLMTCDDLALLDTMLNAYDYLDDREAVINIVTKIVPIAEKAIEASPCDLDVILSVKKNALDMKKKHDG